MDVLSRWSVLGVIVAVLLWQVSSCCCCLGGATAPPMTPFPLSGDLAREMRERFAQTKVQKGAFTLEISDQELTSYVVTLAQSGPGEFPARDMQIQFGDGYADIWATFIDVAPTDLPIYVRATVEAADGQVVFDITQANAGVFPIPGAMRESISQTCSETLAELQFGLQVKQVEIRPGKMILAGEVIGDVPDLP
ncbi:MAG: LmeA family phospholipid-binding protein [Promethearchaeota archaeon]